MGNTARSWSTSWTPIATGRLTWDAMTLRLGQFGENFTVEGLPDAERVFEKGHKQVRRLSMSRMVARSIMVSEVWTLYS